MILRATIPPRSLAEVENTWPVEPHFDWNGETTGSTIGLDAADFTNKLRHRLNAQLKHVNASRSDEARQFIISSARFRNQVALTLWLDAQIESGQEVVELSDFPCVVEYPEYLHDLIFIAPSGSSTHLSLNWLATAWCPRCAITYGLRDLREVEYDLFFGGEYVLTCPRDHQLFVLGWETYLLGG